MVELLNQLIPNVMTRTDVFIESIYETIIMVAWSGAISFVIGMILGVTLTVTKPGNIMEQRVIYQIIDKAVNFFRSIPFIVLLACLVPLTRMIMGTAIGVRGAIVPLVFGCAPFFSRQVESSLAEVDPGVIEAAMSLGLDNKDIIIRVYLKESIASIARGTTITIISLIGLTAMAGAIRAGGLGNFAIMYGHQRNMPDVTYTTVVVLVILVTIIQLIGNYIARKNTH
ncbi:MAG: ABC transporter permease [Lachnospiraceae bacterium]|nr:ABC transporter permease [Lachnospiraceae bacterium]